MFDQANSINTLRSLCSCNLEVYWSGFCEMLLHFIVNLSNGLYLSVNPVTRLRSVTFGVQPSRLLQSTINSHLKKKPVFWLGGYVTFRSFYWQIIVNNNSQQCDSLLASNSDYTNILFGLSRNQSKPRNCVTGWRWNLIFSFLVFFFI